MSVSRAWKVYGIAGHRQAESFCKSYVYDFSTSKETRIIKVLCSDVTKTNDYTVVIITRDSSEECFDEFNGQLSDGIFENQRTGMIEEIQPALFQAS